LEKKRAYTMPRVKKKRTAAGGKTTKNWTLAVKKRVCPSC